MSYPIKEVNRYIQRLVEAGFEDRVMFGTDQMEWPKLMACSISIIQNADYLTPEQKDDMLYNKVARFLGLTRRILNSGRTGRCRHCQRVIAPHIPSRCIFLTLLASCVLDRG